MQRIRLTATEQAQLEQIFKTTDDRRLRDRCQAVFMAHRGRKRKIIAQDLGVHRTTVRFWLRQDQEHGLPGAKPGQEILSTSAEIADCIPPQWRGHATLGG